MSMNLKSFRKLNKITSSALEGAIGLSINKTHSEFDIEHLLIKLLDQTNTDLDNILRQFEIQSACLSKDLTQSLDRLKTGSSRRPLPGVQLVKLVQEAWL
ncbi:MAG: type VI secretion system ATPase TssH, partial [Nitrospira sp.]|nr:type VI secretion system ATPase TssH [Nitrospira sp.]